MDIATARNARFQTILACRLEQGSHRSRLNGAHNLRLPLEHPGHGQKEALTAHRETVAAFIGIPVNATADSTAHSDTKRAHNHNLTPPIQLAEQTTRKALRMQLWIFSQQTTWHRSSELGCTVPKRARRRTRTT